MVEWLTGGLRRFYIGHEVERRSRDCVSQYAEGLVRDVPGATSFDTDGTCCSVAEARFPNQTAPED